ncbi:MAG: (2Fe-2S)-binding protein, partial [Lachnospiraceae bacterium]|nr:(2Fe-2S)-binding protein [Lachnospiraceae bacterium]
MMNITINGVSYEAERGKTILDIARSNDVYIPTLCYMEGVSDIGSCRLCVVEVEGFSKLLPACRTKAKDGMVIKTESEKLTAYRKEMLKLILSNHKQDCMSCPANGTCELQDISNRYGVEHADHPGNRAKIDKTLEIQNANPYITYDPEK